MHDPVSGERQIRPAGHQECVKIRSPDAGEQAQRVRVCGKPAQFTPPVLLSINGPRRADRHWSDQDWATLKKYDPSPGVRGVQAAMTQADLTVRSSTMIRQCAKTAGVRYTARTDHRGAWPLVVRDEYLGPQSNTKW